MRTWLLPGVMILLALLSLVTLKSVAPTLAGSQFIFFLLGAAVFGVTSRLSYSLMSGWRWVAYLGLCFLLIIPLILGTTTRGIAGWIDIGTLFSIQPSQLAIPIITLVIAPILTQLKSHIFERVVSIITLIAIPTLLIVIEPDLGTTVILGLTMTAVLLMSQIPYRYLLALAGVTVVGGILVLTFFLKPYQRARLTSFMDSSADAQGANYNARQALIAVGSGELWGRGLGQGVQSHLRFLPERQTDFIFASMAEEWGFIGSAAVISLYTVMICFCLYVAQRTRSPEGMYFCVAAAMVTLFQSTVNIGMNMGLLPITGVTLPLLSYGGSSILATCFIFGVVQSLSYDVRPKTHLHLS
jgi:rod shape determining protein RodA